MPNNKDGNKCSTVIPVSPLKLSRLLTGNFFLESGSLCKNDCLFCNDKKYVCN